LTDLIASDPAGVLGPRVADEFGPRLPFLLKVLAAEKPLSLQAHPDAAQARAGFEAGNPNYVDPNHKPELLVALDDFEALCGFRDPDESAALLSSLDVPELAPIVAVLGGTGPPGERLRAVVTSLLTSPSLDLVKRMSGYGLAARLTAHNPDDIGVVVALLLNHVVLHPDEAIWMPAGNLHTYLHGTGIEIMAASDNVLRGGLTPKRIDVPELLRVLRFDVLRDPIVRPVPVADGVVTWPAPVRDFALYRVTVDGGTLTVDVPAPRVALCLTGEATVDDGFGRVRLRTGQVAFGAASDHPLTVTGAAEVYLATMGAAGAQTLSG
jgi:mannose-6-phosphate isomerase